MANINTDITPVVIFAYNRPDLLAQVIEGLSKQTQLPDKIIAYVDAAKTPESIEAVSACVEIIQGIRFCNTEIHLRHKNLGCRENVKQGLDEIFSNFRQAVILEDDTYPNPYFYQAMSRMLAQYESNTSIATISGYANIYVDDYAQVFPETVQKLRNIQEDWLETDIFACWGWATWANRWKELSPFETSKVHRLKNLLSIQLKALLCGFYFNYLAYALGFANPWAASTYVQALRASLKHLSPKHSLIKNIGIGNIQSTHTKSTQNDLLIASNYQADFLPEMTSTSLEQYLCENNIKGFSKVTMFKINKKLSRLMSHHELSLGKYYYKF